MKCNSFLTSISLYLIYLIPRVVDAVSFSCHLFLCLIELVGVGGSSQRGWESGGMGMVGWILGGHQQWSNCCGWGSCGGCSCCSLGSVCGRSSMNSSCSIFGSCSNCSSLFGSCSYCTHCIYM